MNDPKDRREEDYPPDLTPEELTGDVMELPPDDPRVGLVDEMFKEDEL